MFLDADNLREKLEPVVFMVLVVFHALPSLFGRVRELPTWYVLAYWSGTRFRTRDARVVSEPVDSTWHVALLPPSWVFGMVWAALHVTTPIALYIYWVKFDSHTASYWGWSFFWYMVLVALECGWTIAFWTFSHRYQMQRAMFGLSYFLIVLTLLDAIALMIFFILDEAWASFALMIPYIAWVAFASYLNLRFLLLGYSLHGDQDMFEGSKARAEYERIQRNYFTTTDTPGGGPQPARRAALQGIKKPGDVMYPQAQIVSRPFGSRPDPLTNSYANGKHNV